MHLKVILHIQAVLTGHVYKLPLNLAVLSFLGSEILSSYMSFFTSDVKGILSTSQDAASPSQTHPPVMPMTDRSYFLHLPSSFLKKKSFRSSDMLCSFFCLLLRCLDVTYRIICHSILLKTEMWENALIRGEDTSHRSM